jgi:hypothetical protein
VGPRAGLDVSEKRIVSYPVRAKKSFLLQNVQTSPGTHPVSYSVGTRALSGVNLSCSELSYSPPTMPWLIMCEAVRLFPLYASMLWIEYFTFTLSFYASYFLDFCLYLR